MISIILSLRFPVNCTSCFMTFVAFLRTPDVWEDPKSSIPSPIPSRSSAWSICKHFRLHRDRYHTSRCSQGSAQHAVNGREWNKHLQKIRWKMVILLLVDWWWLVLCYASMGANCSFMSDTCFKLYRPCTVCHAIGRVSPPWARQGWRTSGWLLAWVLTGNPVRNGC